MAVDNKEVEKKEDKAINAWVCTFCGTPYPTQAQAEQCFDGHSELSIDYVFGGIGDESGLPIECIIKRRERGFVTKIATYKRSEVKDTYYRERMSNEQK